MAEGARLESVFRGNSNVGSNPTLSARFSKKLSNHLLENVAPIELPTNTIADWGTRHNGVVIRAGPAPATLALEQLFEAITAGTPRDR